MLVKAKGNVKDANGWHKAGEVFDTQSDLGDAVEVLDKPKKQPEPKQEPKPETAARETAPETEQEPAKTPVQPRSATRRKKAGA